MMSAWLNWPCPVLSRIIWRCHSFELVFELAAHFGPINVKTLSTVSTSLNRLPNVTNGGSCKLEANSFVVLKRSVFSVPELKNVFCDLISRVGGTRNISQYKLQISLGEKRISLWDILFKKIPPNQKFAFEKFLLPIFARVDLYLSFFIDRWYQFNFRMKVSNKYSLEHCRNWTQDLLVMNWLCKKPRPPQWPTLRVFKHSIQKGVTKTNLRWDKLLVNQVVQLCH